MSVCVVATLSYLAAAMGGTMVVRPQMSWVLWPGNALLVAVLLLVQRRVWPVLIAVAFAAFVLYDLQKGLPLHSIGLLILADMVEVLAGALCLSHAFGGTPELTSMKALVKYSFFGVLLPPFLGAFVGAIATKEEYWTSWGISFFAEALGFLILVPTILVWVRKIRTKDQKPRAYYLEASALLVASVLVGYFIFAAPARSIPSALLYSVVPLLLWATLRFGSVGVGTSVLVVAFLSIWGAVNGRGPFVEPAPLNNVFSLQLFLFFTAGPFLFLAVLVEERKLAEEALSTMSRRLIEAQEQERTWIARELHDDIDQRLAVLSVNLEALGQNPPASRVELTLRIRKEFEMVAELARDVQALSHRLHSSKLEYLGLATAAHSFCSEFSDQQEVEVDFYSDGVPRDLPPEISLCLFRVMQEALQNGIKHSGSRNFEVRLGSALNEIHLSVSDSGIGFNLDEAMKGRGIGLSSMKERLGLVDGEFSVESKLQHGTTIHARVPLRPRKQSAGADK
jgi:signal transduction histidine kinase